MLYRKIEKTLDIWKSEKNHKPLIIKGMRQCGKTYSIQKFAKGTAKSLRHVLTDKEHYNLDFAIKLGDYNVGFDGKVLTLPLYAGEFIN